MLNKYLSYVHCLEQHIFSMKNPKLILAADVTNQLLSMKKDYLWLMEKGIFLSVLRRKFQGARIPYQFEGIDWKGCLFQISMVMCRIPFLWIYACSYALMFHSQTQFAFFAKNQRRTLICSHLISLYHSHTALY